MLVPAVVQAKGDYLALGHITYTDANTPQEFSFNADTFKTLVYSYSFFEKYEIGFVVDFNETEEEVNNTAILLGIEGSFIRIKRGRNTGKFNGVPFDYERNSIQWYRLGIGGGGDAKPLWGIFNGLTYTKFSSPGEIFDDDQSEFVPIRQIDVVMLGMVGVTDLMRKKMLNSYRKSDWGFESDAAFGLARITPHHPQYKEVSTIAFEGTLKAGYYWKLFHNDPYTADESAGGLFLGYRYDFLFDFLGLYRSGDSIYIPERGGWEVRLSFEF
ncbi:MAG: hypothetical protein OEZ39_01520 [Gammaproteobacteria bacterium]|nr:hypothetical protein [Gammaproteobacteria bacterium]